MNRSITTTLFLLLLSFSNLDAANGQNYYRYGDIDTKLNKRAILEITKQELRRLVLENKIPRSWKSVPATKIEKSNYKNSNGWIVSFKNKKIKKIKRQTINVLVDVNGNIKGSAYSK